MPRHHSEPQVGHWYDSSNFPECFMVVDCDKEDYIEVQYLDGELDKIDYETWDTLNPEEVAEPEDANAAYGLEREDDMVKLLNEIEGQTDLEEHLRHIEREDGDEWS